MSNPRLHLHNLDAERAVIAGVILEQGLESFSHECFRDIKAEDFFSAKHQTIWEAAVKLHKAGRPVDELSLGHQLNAMGEFVNVGAGPGINEIADCIEVNAKGFYWKTIILDLSRRRRTVAIGEKIAATASDMGKECHDIALSSIVDLTQISRGSAGELESFADVVREASQMFDAAVAGYDPEPKRKVSWGLGALDKAFGQLCFEDGDGLVVIAAPSGVGKSSLARQIVFSLFINNPDAVVQMFLLETMARQFAVRIAGLASEIPYGPAMNANLLRWWHREVGSMRRGKSAQDREKLHRDWMKFLGSVADKSLFVRSNIFDLAGILSETRASRRLAGRMDLVVVDYMQIVEVTGAERMRGDEAIKHVATSLKALSKEVGCPVIAISSVTTAPGEKAGMNSLRGSRDATFAADRIILVHRPDGQADELPIVEVEVTQAKARDFGPATVKCGFRREITRFEEGK